MAGSGFSLREKDKKRLIKDRIAKAMVTCGGLAVLAALILIFVYLVNMVIPLFSSPTLKPYASGQITTKYQPLAMGIDDSGKYAYTISNDGELRFLSFNHNALSDLSSFNVSNSIQQIALTPNQEGWIALVDSKDDVTLIKPTFLHAYSQHRNLINPDVSYFFDGKATSLHKASTQLSKVAFSVNHGILTLAAAYTDGMVDVRWYSNAKEIHQFSLPINLPDIDQLLMTPDGKTIYLRYGSHLVVAEKSDNAFKVRESVDLSRDTDGVPVKSINLLARAYSLIVSYDNGDIAQWFDVLRSEKRTLTFIRSFTASKGLSFILPDSYRKGFYSFSQGGVVKSYYTTNDRVQTFSGLFDHAPKLAAMSGNEEYLLTYSKGKLSVSQANAYAPEISFSSLWRKVWYESYPKPAYVWQTTSSSHDYEAKFSLMPLTFGTLKAAAFAMLFSLPIAICGAIYTAYFMSETMRRIVKPP